MKETDIISGGEKKLTACIGDGLAYQSHPLAIPAYSDRIVGIIGDDHPAVCKAASRDLGILTIPVISEGFNRNKSEKY